jgi:hypothetical protein
LHSSAILLSLPLAGKRHVRLQGIAGQAQQELKSAWCG